MGRRFEFTFATQFLRSIALAALALLMACCTREKPAIGTHEDNPVKFFLVPSVDARLLESEGKKVKNYLERATGYKFSLSVPTSYIAVVESFGTKRADVSALNTFGYILANERYGAEAKLMFVRYGMDTYQSEIVVRNDSPYKKIEDLNGKKFAYVDPASASGYLVPAKFLLDHKVTPSEVVFAQKHDNVIMMVYQGQVDAGAAWYTPPQNGKIEDARRLVKNQYPDVEEKIRILTLSDPVPNDPFVFRKDLPEEMKQRIVQALMDYMKTEEGKQVFYAIYGATDLRPANDKTYDGVRQILKDLGKSAADLVRKN